MSNPVIISAASQGNTWKGIAVIGVIGMTLWYLIAKTQESAVQAGTMSLSAWLNSLFQGNQERVPIYDEHGCDTTLSTWCQSLTHCVPAGLTCPVFNSNPVITPVTYPTCESWEYLSGGICLRIPGTEPAEEIPYSPGGTDMCSWPDGSPLTVPPGMDCNQAANDMCYRFRSIPGYKGCP